MDSHSNFNEFDSRTPSYVEGQYSMSAIEPREQAAEDRIAKLLEIRRRYSHSETMWNPYTHGDVVRSNNLSMPLQIAAPGDLATIQVDSQQSLEPTDLLSQLHMSLRTGDPHRLLEDMLQHIKTVGSLEYAKTVLSTIPATTFSEILYTLDPKHFLGGLSDLLKEISPSWATALRLPPVNNNGYHELFTLFLRHISTIVYSRGHVFPLAICDYKFLLKCTRVTGDTSAARFIWRKMHEDIRESISAAEFDPNNQVMTGDAECYNHYVATLCWAESANPLQRHRLRIIPRNYIPRTWEQQQFAPLRGHMVGPTGIKSIVATNFRAMVQQKVQPNEETFSLMIVSVARERDLDSVSAILKRVWGVDVHAVMGSGDGETEPTRSYNYSDPLYPTNRLLMAIAHAYSINNSMTMAIRVVDYVARQYNITISRDVWSELLERTFVLSSHKGKNPSQGQLPRIAVSNLWDTMTSEPYNIQPNMKMYNYLITSLIQRQAYGQAQARMSEAFQSQHEDILNLTHRINIFNQSDPDETPVHLLGQRARDLSFQHLRVKLNRQYIRRWVRLLIHRSAKDMRRNEEFAGINMPNIIREWATFLPGVVRYRTNSGLVELRSESRLLNRITQEERMETNRRSMRIQFGAMGKRKSIRGEVSALTSRGSYARRRRDAVKVTNA